jgi:uncharacterized membrane protein
MIGLAIGGSASTIAISIIFYLKNYLTAHKGVGKIILIMGIALLLAGIGLEIYDAMFTIQTYSDVIPANSLPVWFGNVIALTFAILGIVLMILGARELGFHYFDSDGKKASDAIILNLHAKK